jgi:hypothetical protein
MDQGIVFSIQRPGPFGLAVANERISEPWDHLSSFRPGMVIIHIIIGQGHIKRVQTRRKGAWDEICSLFRVILAPVMG